MTPKNAFYFISLIIVIFCFFSRTGYAYQSEFDAHFQVIVAHMTIEEKHPDVESDDYSFYLFGGAGQKDFYEKDQFAYGVETGLFFSMDNDTRLVEVSGGGEGGTIKVQFKNNMLLVDYFGGGYASYTFSDRLRLYAGAGPLLIYGRREIDPEDNNNEIIESEVESQLSLGVYGRTGAELRISENFMLGAGVRYMTSGLKFTGQAGKVKLEGPQYYFNLSFDI
jgi:opacity protein-like surface antigen